MIKVLVTWMCLVVKIHYSLKNCDSFMRRWLLLFPFLDGASEVLMTWSRLYILSVADLSIDLGYLPPGSKCITILRSDICMEIVAYIGLNKGV